MTARATAAGARRGQSEVLSVVLLLGITIAGTGLIVAFGSSALDDSTRSSELDSAEHAMTQFDSKVSMVGIGSSPSQTVSLGLDGRTRVRSDSGWMRVQIVNRTDGTTDVPVMNRTLGKVVYRNADTRIAYQGGGVWRRTDEGSTMVSAPEFHYQGTTLTLPLVTVDGSGTLDGGVRISRDGAGTAKYPNATNRNPLSDGEVNVTVGSDYYEAWGRFFEERTGGQVTYDHDRERVTITLVVPRQTEKVTTALVGTGQGQMTIKGAGGSSFTDSYDSSDGPYPGSPTKPYEGTIVTSGDVELTGGAKIYGDLRTGSGSEVTFGGGATINGNLSYGGQRPDCAGRGGGGPPGGDGPPGSGGPPSLAPPAVGGSLGGVDGPPGAGRSASVLPPGCPVTGWIAGNGSAPDVKPIGSMIDRKVATFGDPSKNRNDAVTAIDGNSWNDAESTLTLPEGAYYVTDADLDSSQKLVFDNSAGDVTLVVDDNVVWNDVNATLTDPNGGMVTVYVGGSKFHVVGGSVGDTTTHRSPTFRVYGGPGLDVRLDDHAEFVGLIYAPDTDARTGSVTIRTQSELFGSIVGGGETLLQAGGSIHYDRAFRTVDPVVDADEGIPQVTYLHVSATNVNVTDE